MLQHLRAGDAALLVDVADDEHRDPLPLGQLHQRHGAVLHLPHAAGRRVQLLVVQGLDGVHDQHVRRLPADTFQHVAQPRLRQDEQVFAVHGQAFGPQLQLPGGLLAGDVQHLAGAAQLLADLEHQRGLADAGRSAHQHQRALHGAAAQHAIQLPHAGGEAYLLILLQRCNGRRLYSIVHTWRFTALGRALRRLLHHGVPRAADGAASRPLGAFAAALRAEKNSFRFHAIPSLVQYWQ